MNTQGRQLKAPAIARHTSLDLGGRRSFLADLVVDYGPPDIMGRLFLKADTEMREKGVRLSFVTFEELVQVNRTHADSWRPILPIFDPAVSDLDSRSSYALIGRNAAGEVVTAHANRYIELAHGVTLKEEIESLRLFYRDPDASKAPGESMRVSAPTPATTTCSVLFTGATWYRKDYRKLDLLDTLAPITRGIGYTRWCPNFCFSFMVPELVRAGIAAKSKLAHVEWEVTMANTPVLRPGTINAALLWSNGAELVQSFADYVQASTRSDAQIDGVVGDRAANQ